MDKNKNIKEAREELENVSGDYEIRRIAELKEKAIRDEISIREYAMKEGMQQGMQQGIQQGIQQGMKQGMKEGKKEGLKQGREQGTISEKNKIAKKMLLLNIDMDVIINTTGLSKEDILKLK